MIYGYNHVAMGAGNIRELHLGNTKAGTVGVQLTVKTTFAPVMTGLSDLNHVNFNQ